jgi:hypothetical protein
VLDNHNGQPRKVLMRGAFYVYARPGLEDFLHFVFSRFNVIIFTAASLPYAWFVIRHFILDNPRHTSQRRKHILAVLTEPQCTMSQSFAKEQGVQSNSPKFLSWLFKEHPEIKCDPKRMVFLDDLPSVRQANPQHCLYTPGFDVLKKGSGKDRFLSDVQGELVGM